MNDPRSAFAAAQAAHAAGRLTEAERGYRAVLAQEPGAVGAWVNLSGVLLEAGALAEAERAARTAVPLAPELVPVHANLIAVLHAGGGYGAAAAAAEAALAAGCRAPEFHYAIGLAHDRAGRWREARAAYAAALALDPVHGPALSEALFLARSCGDFAASRELGARFRAALAADGEGLTPFAFLAERATAAEQRHAATLWCARFGPVAARPAWREGADGRLTVGYASADFHDHPTVHLMAAVLEQHDRSRFRVIGYSWGPDDGSAARARVRASCDAFVELGGVADRAAVERIRADGVQLLVDLKGHTADARPGLFVARAAPLQVNWLGYPGTLGGAAWDAVLADPVVVPPGAERDFSERVLRLPTCYQPNDPRRPRPVAPTDAAAARAAHGLPADAIVLCCMNAAWKIDAERFADWLVVLRAVPGAVLWLLDANPGHGLAVALRNAASAADVDPARLVFAPRAPQPEYLARFALADLFLDTFPYTAHTTASDALWMGCPVLTETGATFASRVATSLLQAVGMPELALGSREGYVAEAIALARDAARLRGLRARLEQGRATAPLWDAARFTADLEAAWLGLAAEARAAAR